MIEIGPNLKDFLGWLVFVVAFIVLAFFALRFFLALYDKD